MPELFVRRIYRPSFIRRFYGFAVASCLGLSLATVGGCTTRMDDMAMPMVPTAPTSLTEIAVVPLAPPEQEDAQPQPTPDVQTIVGVNRNIQRAIRDATDAVGTDSTYLMVVAARESSFDPRKRAHRTSATGLYQFTQKTWLRSVRAFGERHGLGEYARQIVVDERGAVSMRNGAARAKLLRLRADPQISALMAAELARDNEQRLTLKLGRPVAPAEIYMAHLLGVNEAARVIEKARSAPQTPGARLLPAAARSNPDLFRPHGHVTSAKALVSKIAGHYQRQELRFAQQINSKSTRVPWQTNVPDAPRRDRSGDAAPLHKGSLSLASTAP
ncbi:MAG TPA: transglycosylase SLT domain-containing protein [Stellaceae bacterium]|nr:transglycosylase SLT domain-containing protein [Stellaceae bacterium]